MFEFFTLFASTLSIYSINYLLVPTDFTGSNLSKWCTILVFLFPTPGFGGFLVHYSCFCFLYTTLPLASGVQFLFSLSLHHSTACFWCTIHIFSIPTPGFGSFLVHYSYFLDSYTKFWRLLGVLFLFSRFLHQVPAISWCTILVFSISTPSTSNFVVYYSCFLISYTRYYRFLGVLF